MGMPATTGPVLVRARVTPRSAIGTRIMLAELLVEVLTLPVSGSVNRIVDSVDHVIGADSGSTRTW
jgi:hypothetical protein